MREEESYRIDISKPTEFFKRHIEHEENLRIFFSGPFGSGKTFFLNEFFKEYEAKVIHLYPVNYSVASNEDVFELIKYDVLFELLKFEITLDKEVISRQLTFQFFLINHTWDILNAFLDAIPKIGKNISPIKKNLSALAKQFKTFHDQHQTDESSDLFEYLESFTKQKGSIHENDLYTDLIRQLVNRLQEKGEKLFLIVDDLDRIDPEHIFRILNIFSAHFDISSNENKFGFNKVVAVADIDNIRNIFSAKYGQNVDFSGYLDKFYSAEVFYFENKEILDSNLLTLFQQIKFKDANTENTFKIKDRGYHIHEVCKKIFSALIKCEAITIRRLIQLNSIELEIKEYELQFADTEIRLSNHDLLIFMIFDFLKLILGSNYNLHVALKKCAQSFRGINEDIEDHSTKYNYAVFIPIINRDIFKKKGLVSQTVSSYRDTKNNVEFLYELKTINSRWNSLGATVKEVKLIDSQTGSYRLNFFDYLLQTFETLNELNFYK